MKKKQVEKPENPVEQTPQEKDLQWFEKFWANNYPVSTFIEPTKVKALKE